MKIYINAFSNTSLQAVKHKILDMFKTSGCTDVVEVPEKSGNGSIYYNFTNPNNERKWVLIVFDYKAQNRNSHKTNYFPFNSNSMIIVDDEVYDNSGNNLGKLYVGKKEDSTKLDRIYDLNSLRANTNEINMKDITNQQSFNDMISMI